MTEKTERNLIDDSFYVEEKRWGTWQSHYPDGTGIITSLNEEQCVRATRFYLKSKQEGFSNHDGPTYSSTVDGKL
jgi:hypothetical protein